MSTSLDYYDPHLRRRVERLHALGPAPLWHFIKEIDAGADVGDALERYANLPREFIGDHGGDRFPNQVCAIRGGRR